MKVKIDSRGKVGAKEVYPTCAGHFDNDTIEIRFGEYGTSNRIVLHLTNDGASYLMQFLGYFFKQNPERFKYLPTEDELKELP